VASREGRGWRREPRRGRLLQKACTRASILRWVHTQTGADAWRRAPHHDRAPTPGWEGQAALS